MDTRNDARELLVSRRANLAGIERSHPPLIYAAEPGSSGQKPLDLLAGLAATAEREYETRSTTRDAESKAAER